MSIVATDRALAGRKECDLVSEYTFSFREMCASRLSHSTRFWRHAFAIQGSASLRILPNVMVFGAIALIAYYIDSVLMLASLAIEIGPHEVAGALLGLILVLRTNAGYERWWEARKLWGGIVNQSRNLAIDALSYGPTSPEWRSQIVRWTAAFGHVSRASLRGQREVPELEPLLGRKWAERVMAAEHMPNYVASMIGALLRDARDRLHMSEFGFLEVNRQKSLLIDHVGACERILKTPLAHVYSIKISRFVFFFLATLPFAMLHRLEGAWLMPVVTMLISYVILGLDQIGIELQNPFAVQSLSHLPIDDISKRIETDLLTLLRTDGESNPHDEVAQLLGISNRTSSDPGTNGVIPFEGFHVKPDGSNHQVPSLSIP